MAEKWSTGLFQIYSDLPIFLFGSLQPCCMWADNVVAVGEGKGGFGIDGAALCSDRCECCGCVSPYDGNFLITYLICCICPIVTVFWQGTIREKLGIQGSLVGDCCAICCFGNLVAMQTAREIKIRGVGGKSPAPMTMDAQSV